MIDNNFHRKTLSRSDEEFKTSVKVLGLRVRDLRNMIDNLPLVILEDKFEKVPL